MSIKYTVEDMGAAIHAMQAIVDETEGVFDMHGEKHEWDEMIRFGQGPLGDWRWAKDEADKASGCADAIQDLIDVLDDIVNYEGGAVNAVEDENVMERIEKVLAQAKEVTS